ncbi:acyl-CoA dehydrogenase family protein [Streptomyces sp. NPDC051018]|uniref:acyl-CoA dehydrogenase family protein n=1 Tax=Streptomyces sp. NPDC051018 TaxID=3365639 RepID=UPI003795CE2A
MDFQLSDDQRALRAGVRELLERVFDAEALRRAVGTGGLDRELWRALGDAGFFSLRLPEERGGVGLGTVEAVLVFEEAGRTLLPGPLVATHLAAGTVEGAATGEAVVARVDSGLIAWLDAADHVMGAPGPVRGGGEGSTDGGGGGGSGAMDDADGAGRGSGSGAGVPAGPGADRADGGDPAGRTGGGDAPGRAGDGDEAGRADDGDEAGPVPLRSVDPLTPLHRVAAPGTPDPLAALLTAAEQLGSAGRTTGMAVRYAKEREQFGQPVGAFQAVKHLCAQMLVRTELARSAVYAAAVTGDPTEIAGAKLLADDAAVHNARDCLQVHGGMGFTWEADVHLHLKRAWVRARMWPTAAEAEEIQAEALAIAL